MTSAHRPSIFARLTMARQLFLTDSLFRNTVYLVASTAVMSGLGFIFWVFVAHLYDPADIGIASALIAIATLISNLSLLGLTSGLVRFLASSKKPNSDINAAALTVAGITIFAAAVYVLAGVHVGGGIPLLDSSWHKLAFVALMSAVSLNSLSDAVFIANRRGEYHTIGYATFGAVKLVLPLILVPFGAAGIFGSYILAMLASLIVSFYLMQRGCGYRIFAKPDWTFLRRVRRYTLHNYLGVIVAGLPSQLMPLLIIKQLGAPAAGFFSMAWTMVNLLYVVPSAATQSLLAESSYDGRRKAEHIKRTVRLLALLLMPAVALAVIVSPYMLAIFGPQYRQNGTALFQMLALSTVFIAVTSVGNTILNIERHTGRVLVIQLTGSLAIGIAAVFLTRHGLAGVGLSFVIGTFAASLMLGLIWPRGAKPPAAAALFPTSEAELRTLLMPYGIRDFTASVLGNGSNNNCTLLISVADSRRYVLRIYRADTVPDEAIEQEISFTRYLAAGPLRVPQVISSGEGRQLLHYTRRGGRWQYLLMEFIAGNHPAEYTATLAEHMASQQALLHLKGLAYVEGIALYRRHIPRSLQIRQLILGVFVPSGFSHFDFDSSNLLVRQGRICCILDFEGMRFGPLVSCLFFTLSQIYKQHRSRALLSAYLTAYNRTRTLSLLEKSIIRISLMVRYRNPGLLGLRVA